MSADREPTPESLLLGSRVRKLRLQRNWTQKELATRIGHGDRGFLSEIERGVTNPTLTTLLSLAGALEIELLELLVDFGGDPDVTQPDALDRSRAKPQP